MGNVWTHTETKSGHLQLNIDIHRESSLYWRFSQLSREILGDVPFLQDGPHKITQLSTQIENFRTFARPCRPTLWHKLAQMEQVQAPSWYRACAMAQGKASIVGIWLVSWYKERSLLTSPSPSGTGLVQTACLNFDSSHVDPLTSRMKSTAFGRRWRLHMYDVSFVGLRLTKTRLTLINRTRLWSNGRPMVPFASYPQAQINPPSPEFGLWG